MAVVVAEGLRKRFGETQALDGLDLEVEGGTVLGVLGPNGAGKTTAVRVLTTLLEPDAGRATVDGIDVLSRPREVRARIGLTGQYAAVDERLTARENLELVARFFRLRGSEPKLRSAALLTRFDLDDAADRVVKGFSGGMRRRLDVAMSLIARPSVLFLDEPTTGLDPRTRLIMWELIEELVAEGMTTLLTTQYLEEADRLSDKIMVVDHGRVIAEGTADQLKDRVGGARAEIVLGGGGDVEAVLAAIGRHRGASEPVRDGDVLVVGVHATVTGADLVRSLDTAGIGFVDVSVARPTLDDVFFSLTGHAAESSAVEEAAR